MFKGKAELTTPETDEKVGISTETCEDNGTSHLRVVLESPPTLGGTQTLAIFGNLGGVIGVGADTGDPTEMREFQGKIELWLPRGQKRDLPRNEPRRALSTLLIVHSSCWQGGLSSTNTINFVVGTADTGVAA